MKKIISITFLLCYRLFPLFSQVTNVPSKLILNHDGIFLYHCLSEVSAKYNIEVNLRKISCFPLNGEESDSIQANNEQIINDLKSTNGDNWDEKFQNDLLECQKSLCPYGDIDKFYRKGMGNLFSINFNQGQKVLNEEQMCIIRYTLLENLVKNPNMKIELLSYSIDSEKRLSKKRVENYKKFLVKEGVKSNRIKATDMNVKGRLGSNPNELENIRIDFRIIHL